jgi:hypothetical protein
LSSNKKKKIGQLSSHPTTHQHVKDETKEIPTTNNDTKSISSDQNNIEGWEDTAFHYPPKEVKSFDRTLCFVLEFTI